MRLWTIHPKFLDQVGLVALWREGLLAKKVLSHQTKGYKNHPQLLRFKKTTNPEAYINAYLYPIWLEAKKRHYNFDISKISAIKQLPQLTITQGQLEYEMQHLKQKLATRNIQQLAVITETRQIIPHPLFRNIAGKIEDWEIIK